MWIRIFFFSISVACFGLTGEQSFTPAEIQFRVESIIISTEISGGVPAGDMLTLYECTSGDCFLSLMDSIFLDNKKALKQIKSEDYRYVTVTSCSGNETNFKSKLKGNVSINGTSYYTHSTEGLLEQFASTPAQDVDVLFTQCRFYYELQSDLVISDSLESQLTLFMDLSNIAWGRQGVQTMESGCFQGEKGSDDLVFSVCMGVPHMIPISATASPTITKFQIHNKGEAANTAGGELVFFMDKDNNVLGGFSRRIFSSTSKPTVIPEFDMSMKRVTMNANGTYTISTFGSNFNSTFLNFSQFTFNTHENETYSNSEGTSFSYVAVKQ